MNALTVISVAALVAGGSAALLGHGVHGGYHGLLAGHHGVVAGHHGLLGAHHLGYAGAVAPVAYNAHPYHPYRPIEPVRHQYHAQDELGQYSFGYAGGPAARTETRDAYGNVRGSYNYIDSEGKVQTQHYIADALRLTSTM